MPSPRVTKLTEPRRGNVDLSSGWRPRLRELLRWPMAVAATFCAGAFLIVFSSQERLPYFLGQNLTQPVFSRVEFDRVNLLRTAEVRNAAQQEVPSYYRLNKPLLERIEAEFMDLHAAVNAAATLEKFTAASGTRWTLDEAAFNTINSLTDEAGSGTYRREVQKIVRRVAAQNMVERADEERDVRTTSNHVELDRGDGQFVAVSKERLTYAVNEEHVDRLAETAVGTALSAAIRPTLVAIIRRSIGPSADKTDAVYVYDRPYTKEQIEAAGKLEPVRDSYHVGDRLVPAGIVVPEALGLLTAEQDAYRSQRQLDPKLRMQWIKETAGIFGIIVMITAGLAVFTMHVKPRVGRNTTRATALAVLLILMLLADRVVLVGMSTSPIWSVATIVMTAAIFTIAYSPAFAIGVAAALSLLTIMTLEARFGLFLVHLTVTATVSLMLHDIRTRLKMVQVGGVTALAAALSTCFVGLMRQQVFSTLVKEISFAALAALAGISVVLVLLPLIERALRVTTSLTLLEWADTSTPLLRHLIEKAPGTWQHSHLIGSMAETAAEEIGANGLLVRVGAYYHDIGKTCKPQYFVENQSGKHSAHQRLAPTMSLLVILAHVKDGLAMAREFRLPRVLQQFIAEHHGTTIVRYFHAMAAQEARAGGRDARTVSETEFRYPGPKPRSRESAILMLCDGVEGAVRALHEPTPSRIEAVVHEISMARLMDGQFDDSDITLKELFKVEQILVKSLCAFHHGRIAYPKVTDSAAPGQVRTA
ncbi:MAG: HDIG domain-containing protein [Planctomycetia bacterium]|nr:HDIG domain-containing protein [Planctomycetia bacterium]MCC7313575.1 HDIG domain-containing protein [Planctomycetota bacterium]